MLLYGQMASDKFIAFSSNIFKQLTDLPTIGTLVSQQYFVKENEQKR